MDTDENSAAKKPVCPPYRIDINAKPTIYQLKNHPLNVISICFREGVPYFTVQTDDGTLTLTYEKLQMKEIKTLFRKNVFLHLHRNYIMNKRYVASCRCNDEEGYDVIMYYGPDVKVSKLKRCDFKNATGQKPCRKGD